MVLLHHFVISTSVTFKWINVDVGALVSIDTEIVNNPHAQKPRTDQFLRESYPNERYKKTTNGLECFSTDTGKYWLGGEDEEGSIELFFFYLIPNFYRR